MSKMIDYDEYLTRTILLVLLFNYMNLGSKKIKTTDKIVRQKLIRELSADKNSAHVIEELDIERGQVRADVVSIKDNAVHGFEIKSDLDTLMRLPKQVKYYNKVFSTVTLVVGSEHIVEAMYIIPDWWGIVVARYDARGVSLNVIRDAKINSQISYDSVTELMKRDELIGLLNRHTPGISYTAMTKARLKNEAIKNIQHETLMHDLSKILMNRTKSLTSPLKVAF